MTFADSVDVDEPIEVFDLSEEPLVFFGDRDEETLILLDVLPIVDFLICAEYVAHALEGVGLAKRLLLCRAW